MNDDCGFAANDCFEMEAKSVVESADLICETYDSGF